MSKEIKKMRGTARFFEDESFDFIPQKLGTPVQKEVTKVRKSTFYQTNGEKDSSFVMHLNVDANSSDPAAELTEDFDKLVKKISPKATKQLKGKKLMDEDGTTVVVNIKEHKIEVRMSIDLQETPLFKDFYYKQVYKIVQCFTYNDRLIASAYPSQKNSGTK